jgi:hypothetical protein
MRSDPMVIVELIFSNRIIDAHFGVKSIRQKLAEMSDFLIHTPPKYIIAIILKLFSSS